MGSKPVMEKYIQTEIILKNGIKLKIKMDKFQLKQ
jgi:hypothetical protein